MSRTASLYLLAISCIDGEENRLTKSALHPESSFAFQSAGLDKSSS